MAADVTPYLVLPVAVVFLLLAALHIQRMIFLRRIIQKLDNIHAILNRMQRP